MEVDGLQKVRTAIGGKNADIAKLLGVSGAAVSKWGGVVPPKWAIELEKKTGGKVTRYEIRPDFFGAPAATAPTPEAAQPERARPAKPKRRAA